ncbi:phosphotransferase family protein [Streptomyces lunalinharesii]|uniref:Aminoglycoside phosphotransferase domain-containing protein n=1 Tax=Streptomyces lunalinharesii TaxID=333384 RepID=A0ABN3T0T7_9ACTN
MITPPPHAPVQQHVARLNDVAVWEPYVTAILSRHDMVGAGKEPVAGFNTTYPTFLYGDVVVKLFGNIRAWREGFAAERAALALVAGDPEIAAPRLLASGYLFEDDDASWPYLVTTRIAGVPLRHAELSRQEHLSVAAQLGEQVRRVHALGHRGAATPADWPAVDVVGAARNSSLPPHLVEQVDGYLTRLAPLDEVFVHGDLVANHIYVVDGRITGIIDWGDALVTDRHYELGQVHRDTFGCDQALLRVFLDAANWPDCADFPRQALGSALYRQALGLAQHHGFDLFRPIAARYPLRDITTLDELASELFAVKSL